MHCTTITLKKMGKMYWELGNIKKKYFGSYAQVRHMVVCPAETNLYIRILVIITINIGILIIKVVRVIS